MKRKTKMNKKLRGIIIFFFALIISANLFGYMFNGKDLFSSFYQYLSVTSFGFFLGFFLGGGNTLIGRGFGKRLDWRANAEKASRITLLVMVLYGIFISLLIPYIYSKYIWKVPPELLWRHIIPTSFFTLMIDFFFTAVFYSKYLAKYWAQSIRNEEKLEQENLKAKYETLKNQVNPHFLFNSLNTISGLVEQNPSLATKYIKKLSDLYRQILEQKDKELIDVKDELKFVEDYVFLQKIRHGEGLKYSTKGLLKGFVIPMAIQMLVENAIKHNSISEENPLHIELIVEGAFFIVRNNLQKKIVPKTADPIGLENIMMRYSLLSDRKVEILETPGSFSVKLPILEIPE